MAEQEHQHLTPHQKRTTAHVETPRQKDEQAAVSKCVQY